MEVDGGESVKRTDLEMGGMDVDSDDEPFSDDVVVAVVVAAAV